MTHSKVRSGTGRPNSLEVREHRRPSPSVKVEWSCIVRGGSDKTTDRMKIQFMRLHVGAWCLRDPKKIVHGFERKYY